MKDRTHDDATAELFAQDLGFAADYLYHLLQDGEPADLMMALRQMAQSSGGIPALAEKAHLNPTQLYRTLSPTGNPELRSLTAILGALGLRLAVQPVAANE